ncbi:MAG: histidine kinase dimerization/phospho-acceptor domain-containing protein [Bacteroidota bacterium]
MPETRSLLLAHSDADALAEAMERATKGLQIAPCDSLVAARAHLVGTRFDAILASAVLPDGPSASLLELDVAVPPLLARADDARQRDEAARAGASFAFVAEPDPGVLAAVATWALGVPAAPAPTPPASGDEQTHLQTVADDLAHLAHAINNPLAVIVGNAQLARELQSVSPDDAMVREAISDIETASRELVALMDEMQALRRRVDEALS